MAWGLSWEDLNPATLVAGTATTQTLTRSVTSGEVVVATAVSGGAGTVTGAVFTDSQGNVWTPDKTTTNGFYSVSTAHAVMSATGSITITATYNVAVGFRGIKAVGYTGINTTTPLDGTPNGSQQTVAAGTDNLTSGTITTTGTGVIYGVTWDLGNNITPTAGTGFTSTRVDWAAQFGGCRIEYKSITAGSNAALFSSPGPSDAWVVHGVALQEASGGGVTGWGYESASPMPRARRLARTDSAQPPPAVNKRHAPIDALAPRPRARRLIVESPAPLPTITGLPVIAGLKLWLRGDLGVTLSSGNAVSWLDQSGSGNHTTNSGTVPFVASGLLNGRPALMTTGAAGMVGTTDPLTAGSPRTVFVVFRSTTPDAGIAVVLRTTTIGPVYLVAGTGSGYGAGVVHYNSDIFDPMSVTPPGDLTNAGKIAEWTVTGGGGVFPIFKLNGVRPTVTASGGATTETGASGFGIGTTSVAPFNSLGSVGEIYEVLIYDSVLNSTDEASVTRYLAVRYGFAVDPAALIQNDVAMRRPAPRRVIVGADAISAPTIAPVTAWEPDQSASRPAPHFSRPPSGGEPVPALIAPPVLSWTPDIQPTAQRQSLGRRETGTAQIVVAGPVGAWVHVNDIPRLRRATRIHDSAGVLVQLQAAPLTAYAPADQATRPKRRPAPGYQLVTVIPAIPIIGPPLVPPLWAVVDGVSLSIDVDFVSLSSAVDATTLEIDGDT